MGRIKCSINLKDNISLFCVDKVYQWYYILVLLLPNMLNGKIDNVFSIRLCFIMKNVVTQVVLMGEKNS